jgi:hypothetical protein
MKSNVIVNIFLDLGTSWRWLAGFSPGRFTPEEGAPGTHWIGGWVDHRAGLDDVKRKFLTIPGLELRTLGHPARSQSLYRLRYSGLRVIAWNVEHCKLCEGFQLMLLNLTMRNSVICSVMQSSAGVHLACGSCLFLAGLFLGLLLYTEDRGENLLRNARVFVMIYKALQPRRWYKFRIIFILVDEGDSYVYCRLNIWSVVGSEPDIRNKIYLPN